MEEEERSIQVDIQRLKEAGKELKQRRKMRRQVYLGTDNYETPINPTAGTPVERVYSCTSVLPKGVHRGSPSPEELKILMQSMTSQRQNKPNMTEQMYP